MRFVQKIFWILVFVVSTFCWTVLFEHGTDGFAEGVRIELDKLQKWNFGRPVDRRDDLSDGVVP